MKDTVTDEPRSNSVGELRAEYRLDYQKARPNRFAGRTKDRVVVVLDPDVSTVVTTSESVNAVLRALIGAMPEVKHKTVKRPTPNHQS